jgi:hypothetical protein
MDRSRTPPDAAREPPAWDGPPYDEVLDAAGEPRGGYADLAQRLGWDPLRPPEAVTRPFAGRPFGDSTRVLPVPLVLDGAEHRDRIQAGVAQRARALQRFFADAVLEDGRFLRAGSGLTESLLDEILASEGTSLRELRGWWSGQALDAIRFVYGPDLAREPGGRWVVLEDNVGCVSGCADSFLALDAYLAASGLGQEVARRPDLAVAVESWLARLDLAPGDPGVLALLTDAEAARWSEGVRLQEDVRRQRLVGELGVGVVDNADLERIAGESGRGLTGLRAIFNLGVPTARTWPLLLDAFFGRARVPLANAPGTSVLGNKALLPFVGPMVAFYCGEEVLLDAPPTAVLRGGVLPGPGHRGGPGDWVVKAAAGCDGAGVFHLRSQTPEQLRAIERMLEGSWPAGAAIAQRRVELSHLSSGDGSGHRVELRALGYVLGWQDVLSGEQCLARLTPPDGGPAGEDRGPRVAPVLTAVGRPDRHPAGVRA